LKVSEELVDVDCYSQKRSMNYLAKLEITNRKKNTTTTNNLLEPLSLTRS